MFNSFIIRYNEIAIKGKNRRWFEDILASNVRFSIGEFASVTKIHGRILIEQSKNKDFDVEEIMQRLKFIPGIASFSPALMFDGDVDWSEIEKNSLILADKAIEEGNTIFRVSASRSIKSYPKTSMQIAKELSSFVLKNRDGIFKVSMKDFNFNLEVEVDKSKIFLFMKRFQGVGGLPVGTAGKVLVLLSGGIDSPVAAYKTMKRGATLNFLSFYSPPYTGEESMKKLRDLAFSLKKYHGRKMRLFIAPLIDIQLLIRARCLESYRTVLFRRVMFQIAEKLSQKEGFQALVTGESLSQVASQTIENLTCINQAVKNLPVLRPLIAFDKNETIAIAEQIGTFEISKKQTPDSCTAFLPKNPVIRGTVERVLKEEEKLKPEIDELIETSLKEIEIIEIK